MERVAKERRSASPCFGYRQSSAYYRVKSGLPDSWIRWITNFYPQFVLLLVSWRGYRVPESLAALFAHLRRQSCLWERHNGDQTRRVWDIFTPTPTHPNPTINFKLSNYSCRTASKISHAFYTRHQHDIFHVKLKCFVTLVGAGNQLTRVSGRSGVPQNWSGKKNTSVTETKVSRFYTATVATAEKQLPTTSSSNTESHASQRQQTALDNALVTE